MFRRCGGRGCGHVFGLLRGVEDPPALMLSADPLPRSRERALAAQTMPRASGSIRFPAHHLLVTLDSSAAVLLASLGCEPSRRSLRRNFPIDRRAAHDRERDARHLVGKRHGDELEGLLLDQLLRPHPQWVGIPPGAAAFSGWIPRRCCAAKSALRARLGADGLPSFAEIQAATDGERSAGLVCARQSM
jgi:hypothetical protein